MTTKSQKTRVLFLNRSYWPDSEATGQLLTELCESLAQEFDVHVLAGQPNAESEKDWQGQLSRNGVVIHRVRHTLFPKSNMLLKSVNFISFVIACRRQILSLPQPDIVVFETDPFLLPFVADRLHRKCGVRMVGYLQDIYPDVAIALHKVKDSWWVRWLRRRLFDVYKRCERIVVLSTDMRQLLLDDGIPESKVSIVPNWADTEKIQPIRKEENRFIERQGLRDKFVVMYSGNLGLTQRLEEFVEAAALLKDEGNVEFVFIGRGAMTLSLQQRAKALGVMNIRFLDYQPKEELAQSLGAGDLHLVPLTKELSRCLMPSKLYGILAAGKPYLTNAHHSSQLYQLTLQHGVGIVVQPRSPSLIAEKIREAARDQVELRNKGRRARELAEAQYSFGKSQDAFLDVMRSVI